MIIASNNKNKIKEIKDILKIELKSLQECGIDIDVPETGSTIEENAYIKAKAIFDLTNEPCIADDSGLFMEAFPGYPGINTKRIAEEFNYDEDKRNEILIEKGKTTDNKNIEARCSLCYVDKDNVITVTGVNKGTIADKPYIKNGFGFDKIMILPDGRYVSMLDKEEKNKLSHRYKACVLLKEKLKELNII